MALETENTKCKYTETKMHSVHVTETIHGVEEWKVHDCRACVVSSEDIAIRRVVLIHFLIFYLGKWDEVFLAVCSCCIDSLRHREIVCIFQCVCLFLSFFAFQSNPSCCSATLRKLKTRYVSLMSIWPSKGDANPLDWRHTLTLMLAWFCMKALTGVGVCWVLAQNEISVVWEILLPTVQELRRRNDLWVFFTLLWMGLQYSALDGTRVANSSHITQASQSNWDLTQLIPTTALQRMHFTTKDGALRHSEHN